jgi:hypothetical protein
MQSLKTLSFCWIVILLLLVSSCGPPLCPMQSMIPGKTGCKVRPQHYHDGTLYKGMPWYKKQHLRYGEKYRNPKGKRKPAPAGPNQKTKATKPKKSKQKLIVN